MASRFVRSARQVQDINNYPTHISEENDLISTKDGKVYIKTINGYEQIELQSSNNNDYSSQIKTLKSENTKLKNRIKSLEDKQSNIDERLTYIEENSQANE